MEESKVSLRRVVQSLRAVSSPAERRSWSGCIQAAALRFAPYVSATEVALYSAVDNEVDTAAIIVDALQREKKVFFPRIASDSSAWFFRVGCQTDLRIGRFGIAEPTTNNPLRLPPPGKCQSLIIFVPGVAFDVSGHRLGRGGGWYDRMLAAVKGHGTTVGLAFELQIVAPWATETWDQKVDYLITEKRLIDCGAAAP